MVNLFFFSAFMCNDMASRGMNLSSVETCVQSAFARVKDFVKSEFDPKTVITPWLKGHGYSVFSSLKAAEGLQALCAFLNEQGRLGISSTGVTVKVSSQAPTAVKQAAKEAAKAIQEIPNVIPAIHSATREELLAQVTKLPDEAIELCIRDILQQEPEKGIEFQPMEKTAEQVRSASIRRMIDEEEAGPSFVGELEREIILPKKAKGKKKISVSVSVPKTLRKKTLKAVKEIQELREMVSVPFTKKVVKKLKANIPTGMHYLLNKRNFQGDDLKAICRERGIEAPDTRSSGQLYKACFPEMYQPYFKQIQEGKIFSFVPSWESEPSLGDYPYELSVPQMKKLCQNAGISLNGITAPSDIFNACVAGPARDFYVKIKRNGKSIFKRQDMIGPEDMILKHAKKKASFGKSKPRVRKLKTSRVSTRRLRPRFGSDYMAGRYRGMMTNRGAEWSDVGDVSMDFINPSSGCVEYYGPRLPNMTGSKKTMFNPVGRF